MRLAALIWPRRQSEFYGQLDINGLARMGSEPLAARTPSAPKQLEYSPEPAPKRQPKARVERQPKRRSKSAAKGVQCNFRLNPELQRALRSYAKRNKLTLGEAVEAALGLLLGDGELAHA